MKVLIVEDERLAAEKLRNLILQVNPDSEITGVLETVEESVNWFNSNQHPDIIFMDIQLNDGVCFEIFESVKIDTPVIFTTAFNEYAIQAFKVNSIDYLLKPIKFDELKKAMEKYHTFYKKGGINFELDQVLNQFNKKYKERFFVKVGHHFKSILSDEIQCFYIDQRCTFIFTHGQSYDIDYSLEQIEKLVSPEVFFRVNRNFIIQINAIEDILIYSTSRLKIKIKRWNSQSEIIVSREKVGEFKKWIDR